MSLFTPNTDFYTSYYDKERYLLAWRTSIIFMCVFLVLLIMIVLQNSVGVLPISITFGISVVSTFYLHLTKNFKTIFWVYALTGSIVSNFAMNYVMTSTHYVDFMWMLTSVLAAFIGLGRRVGVVFIGLNIFGAIYYYFFSLNIMLSTISEKSNLGLVAELVELIFAFLVVTYLMSKFSEFQKMSEKNVQLANEETQIQSSENEVLVKEIHHRVKNNLQIIISLLRLQKNEIASEEARQSFSEAISRIMVMSLIHQKLYQDKSLAEIKIKDYLTNLTSDIASLTTLEIPIKVDIQSNIEKVGLKTIVPLGLIVNELMSNSIEHAFSLQKEAAVFISIKALENNMFELIYFDNGSWTKKAEDYSSFGIELIDTLTSQLEGECKREISLNGTSYSFILKNVDV